MDQRTGGLQQVLHVPQGATRLFGHCFFLETSYNLLNSLKSGQLVKIFEIRTPPIQRAFRMAEVDILTTAVTRQEFDCFSKITGNYYFCDPARSSFSF